MLRLHSLQSAKKKKKNLPDNNHFEADIKSDNTSWF